MSRNIITPIKTRMCTQFKIGCTNARCTFAHNKTELNLPVCGFRERCRNQNCNYWHPGNKVPTQDEIFDRATAGIVYLTASPSSSSPPITLGTHGMHESRVHRASNERSSELPQHDSKKFSTDSLARTKMCIQYLVGCKKDGCTFAHSSSELVPAMCGYNDRCRNRSCKFYHTNQPIPSASDLFDIVSAGVKFAVSQQAPPQPDVVITISDDGDSDDEGEVPSHDSKKSCDDMMSELDVIISGGILECNSLSTDLIPSIIDAHEVKPTHRVQFEATMTADEQRDLMRYMRSRGLAPIISSIV